MRVAVINCSAIGMKGQAIYNLGVDRIANYHLQRGDDVVYKGGWNPMEALQADKIYFSAIFTWDIPGLIMQVGHARDMEKQVEIGGPAATFMANYILSRTGVTVHRGLDQRFEHVAGKYEMIFSSRGCPNKCQYCGVKKVEPVFTCYDVFPLAHMVGDNNILATPMSHQRLVVDRLKGLKGKIDFNSGFDVRFFREEHYELYSQLKLKYWRFAFDSMEVEDDVKRVGKMMRSYGLDRHKVAFYCLIGFPGQSPEDAIYRLKTIIDMGHNPYPMRFWPLNSLDRSYVAPGWTEDLLYRMSQYYQAPYNWKSDSWVNFEEFDRTKKKLGKTQAEQAGFI